MHYRSLLVLLDGDAGCDARVELAARYAAEHDNHLLGIAPTGLVELPGAVMGASRQLEDAAVARAGSLQDAHEHVQRFRALCRAERVAACDAVVCEGDKLATVLHQALRCDLVVVGLPCTDSPTFREDKRLVEQVMVHNARPTLLVPAVGRTRRFGQDVLVAWDDSRGAARATADAMPLLRFARKVHLRAWCRVGDAIGSALRERLASVQEWLMRQGVPCEALVEATHAPIGETLLDCAAGLDVDLVVMGAYGHSRWTERIVGGVTRTALKRSSVPLLMSH